MNATRNAQAALGQYEQSLSEAFKKEHGIFYTDLSLAEKIIAELQIEGDPIILDPCCGTGSFLHAAQSRGYRRLFGIDQDAAAVQLCVSGISGGKFLAADSIGAPAAQTMRLLGLDEKADYIVGNPPFVPLAGRPPGGMADAHMSQKLTGSGNNLFVAALLRSLEFLKPGGILCYILPKNLLHIGSYRPLRQELLREKTIISIIDIGSYFPAVRGEQIVLTVKNSPPVKNVIQFKRLCGGRFDPLTRISQDFYSDEIYLFRSDADYRLYRKLSAQYPALGALSPLSISRGKSSGESAVSGKDIRKFGYKRAAVPTAGRRILIQNVYSSESGIIAAFGGELDAAQTVTVLTAESSDICRYLLGIFHSRLCNFFLCKYVYNDSKFTMHTDAKYLKKIPLPQRGPGHETAIIGLARRLEQGDYMSRDWLDNLELLNRAVYDAYDISAEETEYINREMKKIQSKRWNTDG